MNWLRAYFSVPLKVPALLMDIYKSNRAWLDARLARKPAAGWLKGFMLITVVAWFVIWLFAKDEYRERLNQALESLW